MDNRFYNEVIAEMQPFLDENGFKSAEDIFVNDTKAVKINYDEEKQMYFLYIADISDGNVGEFVESSAFLFDDSQSAKDAASVGIDFVDTLRKSLGIKISRKAGGADAIDLPTAQKGSALNISGFTKRVLDVFTQFKEPYKEHIAKYGNFLYMSFFSETLIPQIRDILKDGNKKQIKKLFDLMHEGYIKGDRETSDFAAAAIAAAIADDEALKSVAADMLQSDTNMSASVMSLVPVISKKSKLRSMLIK